MLRGVNFGPRSKLPPFLPVYPLHLRTVGADPKVFAAELDRVRARLSVLPRLGFNTVRLLVMWKGVEPVFNPKPEQLTPEGVAYLERVRDLVLELKRLGLYCFIDFHQDLAHELYGGDGFPDWALAVDVDHPRPERPPAPNHGWGLGYYNVFFAPLPQKLIRHTLRSFWQNSLSNETLRAYPVRDHFAATMGATAEFFMRSPEVRDNILGYEPFNEPHQVGIDDVLFEGEILSDFYKDVFRAVRKHDPKAFVFAEPRVDWTTYQLGGPEFMFLNHTTEPATALGIEDDGDEGWVFSFHYYDPELLEQAAKELWFIKLLAGDAMLKKERQWTPTFDRMFQAAKSRNMVPVLTEFGGSQDWEPPRFTTKLRPDAFEGSMIAAYMGEQLEQAERYCLSWTYWSFDLYNTADDGDHFNHENFSLLGPGWQLRHANVFVRPYPMRSTAEPELLWFELETERFALVLKGTPVSRDLPTVISVPREYRYFKGMEVRTSGAQGRAVEWDAEKHLLYWWPDPSASEHLLTLNRPGEFAGNALPPRARQLAGSLTLRRELA
jgi:endoglycosylceramidase